MKLRQRIKDAAAKAAHTAVEGQAAAIEARELIAKMIALVDVAADLLGELEEQGIEIELTINGVPMPVGIKLSLPDEEG